jgi:hypothetical protein
MRPKFHQLNFYKNTKRTVIRSSDKKFPPIRVEYTLLLNILNFTYNSIDANLRNHIVNTALNL